MYVCMFVDFYVLVQPFIYQPYIYISNYSMQVIVLTQVVDIALLSSLTSHRDVCKCAHYFSLERVHINSSPMAVGCWG